MSGLSLKEQGRNQPIKMIEYVENEGGKETFETNLLAISPDSAQATDGLESSGQISNGLFEDRQELKYDIQDNDKTNDYRIEDTKAKLELGAEKSDELKNPLVLAVQYQYESEGSKNGENTAEMSDDSIEEKESDVQLTRISSEIETSNIVSESETNKDLHDSHDFSIVEGSTVPEQVYAENMDHGT
ncbi:uncharacterized protein LOC119979846 [Tripterygium wilfordii]|uniref:uncharacterized protein LOC119979846 n=1 Tax=Tripterygium wilfordii TaxID=458696 RepID=UPI0018F82BE8|nr:uncharacterized protein LOC119979846 [Tripterygium wilfordii]